MNTSSSTPSKINPKNILGGMGFFDETDFEKETSIAHIIISSVKDLAGGVYEAGADLSQTIVIAEAKPETNGNGKFSSGTIEFNNKKKAEANRQRAFFQALKEDQTKVQAEKDRVFEEEISDIITNLPTEQKNQLLHYQASYKDKSIYQRAELRRKIIEQRNNAEKQQKDASIPNPSKQPSALEGAFEGGSGTQGSGTSNLSAQAVG